MLTASDSERASLASGTLASTKRNGAGIATGPTLTGVWLFLSEKTWRPAVSAGAAVRLAPPRSLGARAGIRSLPIHLSVSFRALQPVRSVQRMRYRSRDRSSCRRFILATDPKIILARPRRPIVRPCRCLSIRLPCLAFRLLFWAEAFQAQRRGALQCRRFPVSASNFPTSLLLSFPIGNNRLECLSVRQLQNGRRVRVAQFAYPHRGSGGGGQEWITRAQKRPLPRCGKEC